MSDNPLAVSAIISNIGPQFDGNQNGALAGPEKWAFLGELMSRLGSAQNVGATNYAEGTGNVTGQDQLDLRQVTWLDANLTGWPQTSTITNISIGDPPITIEHTKAGQWPHIEVGGQVLEGNPWVFAQIDGQWYASTYEWLRPGQTSKNISADNIGAHTKRSPLADWQPRSGDTVGFMVSTPARFGEQGPLAERSNVVLAKWP